MTTAAELAAAFDELRKTVDSACAQRDRMLVLLRRIPIVKRSDTPPFSTCLGCGAFDDQPCADGCWVNELESIVGVGR
jgi:hypothetical protein